MRDKLQTRSLIQSFFYLIKTHFNCNLKTIRSDNGPEFHTDDFYRFKGIIHQLSCVETPQQNGVFERKHQHLFNIARSIKFQANLSHKFWDDCILTVTHLLNRTPTAVLVHKSPYEILHQIKPSYTHLRVFGCLCYASTLKRNRTKFDPKAIPCIFLGYPYGMKAYKLYNLQTQTTFVSRDVYFHENVFPFHQPSFLHSLSKSSVSPHDSFLFALQPHSHLDGYSPISDFAPPHFPSELSSSSSYSQYKYSQCKLVFYIHLN